MYNSWSVRHHYYVPYRLHAGTGLFVPSLAPPRFFSKAARYWIWEGPGDEASLCQLPSHNSWSVRLSWVHHYYVTVLNLHACWYGLFVPTNNRFEAPAAIAGSLIISRGGVPRCCVYAVYESVSKLHSLLDSLFKVPFCAIYGLGCFQWRPYKARHCVHLNSLYYVTLTFSLS